ncbi:HlyD family secretion protein [Pelagibius sp.]|uniref:HlyD family secretion protein n=1 Tax=Pelagibius sp. TaxID=1931238 RepID=UPI0026321568|nr:HlyD family secretion protein [Pelagibius sp.]
MTARPTAARLLAPALLAAALLTTLAACEPAAEAGRFTGYVEAELIYVAAPVSGWMVAAPLREGDSVVREELLFELDKDRQHAEVAEAKDRLRQAEAQVRDLSTGARAEEILALEAQLEEAEANLQLARLEQTRWMELVARGTAPKARGDQVTSEYEAALARVRTIQADIRVANLAARDGAREAAAAERDAAAAALAQAEWWLAQRSVLSRVDATVEEVFHRTGEYVREGDPVLALLPDDASKVRFFVPQAELPAIALDTEVEILVDGETGPLTARITHIARDAEFTPPVIYSADSRDKLVFLVEAHLAGPALRPGLPVDVRLP